MFIFNLYIKIKLKQYRNEIVIVSNKSFKMSTVSKSTMKSLQKNFDHINDLPLVKKLNKKISKLKKENKSLQRVIMHFGESLQNIKQIDVVDLACE